MKLSQPALFSLGLVQRGVLTGLTAVRGCGTDSD